MDIQQLISYIHELETENKQLQKHIYNIQQQLNQKNQSIVLTTKKINELNEHIQKCQNQIIKRQERQIVHLHDIEELKNQIGVYLEEINCLRKADKEQNREVRVQVGQVEKSVGSARPAKMPPKAQVKCRNCQILGNDKQMLIVQLQKQRERCYLILRDLQCVIGTFCNS